MSVDNQYGGSLDFNGGGFSVNSLMMKAGISPIQTLNTGIIGGDSNKVSDLFNNLVIPNWTLSYNSPDKVIDTSMIGGNTKTKTKPDTDDDVIHDDLFNKLFELVKHDDAHKKILKKKMTRKFKKTERKNNKSKKSKD